MMPMSSAAAPMPTPMSVERLVRSMPPCRCSPLTGFSPDRPGSPSPPSASASPSPPSSGGGSCEVLGSSAGASSGGASSGGASSGGGASSAGAAGSSSPLGG